MHPDQVYHVQHRIKIDDHYENTVSDLIFVESRPVAVLAWEGEPGDERPLVSVSLDPECLEEFHSGSITHLYQDPIDFPA
jgi:hypothetical protein